MSSEFQRVAIVNRGEPAMRLIHAVRELNRAAGDHAGPLRTIALFTTPDRRAMFVREADEAVDLGAATFVDERDGERKSSYLDYPRLERALVTARADAAWVGWGFVAEHAAFAELCRRLGIVFIGPEPNVMRWLGDKIASKHLAERVSVPVVPWSGGAVDTLDDARRHAERLGFPVLFKATAGGGGRGIRTVRSAAELTEAFERARAEALRAFGDATVFLERQLTGARHVEVQIIADHYGTTWAVGVRDCTIQRRHQKVLEEAPSPVLSAEQDQALRDAAVRLCQSAGYRNAGTVEFLLDPAGHTFFFMEVNTRLQVEHPVTEMTTGLDLVKLQLHVARGGRLVGGPPAPSGHAIEVRLNAEDADNNFAPAPGIIEVFRLPTGPGLRIDTGVDGGDAVPPEFDSMIAKLIAYGCDRREALARLQRGLADSIVVMRDGTTNKAFLLALLERAEVRGASADTGWLDRLAAASQHVVRRHADVALLQAAIEVYDAELGLQQSQFYAWAARGRPRVRPEIGQVAQLRYRGHRYKLAVFALGPNLYRIDVGGQRVDVEMERFGTFERWLSCAGRRFRVVSVVQGLTHRVEVDGVPHRITRDDGGIVRAPSPAVVLSIPVQAGDVVAAGARLVVLESMKMELPVLAPCAGRVREILVMQNVQVDTATPLLLLDPLESDEPVAGGERVPFTPPDHARLEGETPRQRCHRNLADLLHLMLGFDVDPSETKQLLAEHVEMCRDLPIDDDELRRAEDQILSVFADLNALFRRQPASDDPDASDVLRAEEYLFTYLRGLDGGAKRLPASFLDRLRRALLHYGVDNLERSPQLEASLLRIFKSHERSEQQSAVILRLLEQRLANVDALLPHADAAFRALLDRLVAVTHGRFPVLSEIAREVRYRYFDQPLFEQVRRRVYADMEEHLGYLARSPTAVDRAERIASLVSCPQPLVSVLADRFADADAAMRELMLEVLTRRYYRIREIETLGCHALGEQSCATAEYGFQGVRIHVLATHAEYTALSDAARRFCPRLQELPGDHDVVMDFYMWSRQPLPSADVTQGEIHSMLNAVTFPRRIRRIVVVVAGPGHPPGISGVQHFTYRPSADGYAEEKLYRGLHPMMGKRMHLWRLSNFDIQRLPSVEDVYLFHGVARQNPRDARLFAIAEVRDLTPVRDASGRIVQLPYLERMLMEALAAIRRFQSQRPPHDRLQWNRVLLYVWPPLDLQPDELNALVRKLAPATEGLGIEQVGVRARIPSAESGVLQDTVLRISNPGGNGLLMTSAPPPQRPLEPLSEYDQKVVRLRQRGLVYPYEVIAMLTPGRDAAQAEFPPGEFVEYDLDVENCLVPVQRPPGRNTANVVVGVIRNFTAKYPEGMKRVILLGDPSKAMGAVAEPECRRINAALDLAAELHVPLEWFPVSAGAKISMQSGTENMDWIACVLRRLIEFTQAGGEVNVVVNGINVGAQPYWNAEATMLLHTRGILVMTPQGAMVLTGKQALDYSGSISAEDNQGIGGYERIMGPNGQAQYWARDITDAVHVLLRHYEHTYVFPGERFPRRAATNDPADRDVRVYPHGGNGFALVGGIFSNEQNPGRKHPFEIRSVMMAVVDQDHAPLERWAAMRDAEIGVVWDAHLGGYPVCLIGIESHPLPRLGFLPADGPDQWTAGTLFPKSSKKLARAINAASGNRPVVILANLSGFDGSPESMRELQLEYGAEIGRAVVNFAGPIVFCVVSRYHGGAYVVFSGKLNEGIEVAALEGSYASVIGGAPAAAVVFAGDVAERARHDPRVVALETQIAAAEGSEKVRLRAQLDEIFKAVHSEKLGEVADEFDKVHSVYRALQMGSLDHIIPPERLRPYLIEAVERGMSRRRHAPDQRATSLRNVPLGDAARNDPLADANFTATAVR
jgi:acetyl/propionyl-CoA carboxylase alpha subunit/acetyl-CoA carboxylase carboxyltransferase component